MKGWIALTALSVIVASAVGSAPSAAADTTDPVPGATCPQEQVTNTAVSPDGVQLRCLSAPPGFTWQVDLGGDQAEPATAGQQAWVDCMVSNHTGAECANMIDGAPPPSTGATSSYIPGTGTFRIPTDVAPGVYESRGGVADGICVWTRYASASGDLSDVLDSGSSAGLQHAKITGGAGIFETTNCRPWTRVR
ncbi:MAG TPA: hypothetical protein VHI10_14325 [Mycobacterium sp.]|nr:hypothetical protein [Mycobacterium sp.]